MKFLEKIYGRLILKPSAFSVIVFVLNPSLEILATLFFFFFFFFKRFENHFRLTRNKRSETSISRKYPWHVFQTRNLQLQCCKATRNDGREGKKPRQKMFRRERCKTYPRISPVSGQNNANFPLRETFFRLSLYHTISSLC